MSSQPKDRTGTLAPDGGTSRAQSPGSKRIKCEHLPTIGTASTIGKAPTSRVYTKDYSKMEPELSDNDMVSPYLGNPLRW